MQNLQRFHRRESCQKLCRNQTDESEKSMKKCSTAAFWLSAALATLALPVAASQTCEFRAPTPDMHQVIPGDTL